MRTSSDPTLTRIFVPTMDCPDEEREIRAALSRLPGVESLTFHLFSRQVEVRHRGEVEPILDALRRIGMEGRPLGDALRRAEIPSSDRTPRNTFLLSGAALLLGVAARILFPAEPLVRLPFLASILLGGAPVALRGFREARNRSLGMNALMTISIGGAALLGEWTEAAVVVTLFALANTLEARSLDRARRATVDLFASSPERAVIRLGGPGGEERIVLAEEVRPGDTLVVRPGERVPVDAVILRGASDLNESVLTGESVPVEKNEGDALFAGTVNGRSPLLAEATRALSESTYARILRRVEEAQAQKAPVQTFMDRFAAAYTPAVLCAAVLVAAVPPLMGRGPALDWAYRALVVLVIACPCAIVLAAPVVTLSALTRATREGILVKGARYLEALGKIRVVAFDKTGTLTRGRLSVTRVRAAAGWTEEEVLRLSGAVEAGSAHPVAEAIRREAARRGMATAARGTLARTFTSVEGQGVAAEVEGRKVFVGNRRLFEGLGHGIGELDRLIENGDSAAALLAIVGTQDALAGAVEMEDELRPEAPEAVRSLRELGVPHLVLLTGDHAEAARKAGRAAGIEFVEHGLLPDDKLARVRDLVSTHGATAMVGDGVNDAPALALATVGVAIAAAGSPAAMETADVALMTGDLRRIPSAVVLGRRMVSVVRQNVMLSLAIKAVFLAMAVAGYATLWMAVLADMGTTLLVIFNGMRLLRSRTAFH
ncbi:MAG: heavy metal translocating P-type ATPase [Deltaproteobacteria bacterium]|nr:heavy metal translocating P-type ATPase [Deltaproteobacteria bacterium]